MEGQPALSTKGADLSVCWTEASPSAAVWCVGGGGAGRGLAGGLGWMVAIELAEL